MVINLLSVNLFLVEVNYFLCINYQMSKDKMEYVLLVIKWKLEKFSGTVHKISKNFAEIFFFYLFILYLVIFRLYFLTFFLPGNTGLWITGPMNINCIYMKHQVVWSLFWQLIYKLEMSEIYYITCIVLLVTKYLSFFLPNHDFIFAI